MGLGFASRYKWHLENRNLRIFWKRDIHNNSGDELDFDEIATDKVGGIFYFFLNIMMNIKLYVLIASAVILMISGCVEEKPELKTENDVNDSINKTNNLLNDTTVKEKEIPFETVSKGVDSGHKERKKYTITDNSDWMNLWDIHISPPLPEVDFNQEMIIAVFYGTIASGGYTTKITKVIENKTNLVVFIKEIIPGKSCIVSAGETSPYHIIKIQKVDKEVIFNVDKEVIYCDGR
ncbi:MAG: protease complex subunit PrcB family protein [Methanosarcinales archaeon]|uniref:Protease complex subunit PrcB family protein n=1 Tax=Candidatus Ethanoperedens thermophilum TaxID=2766897 RepID=A0A848D9W9_9EURY|nr:protease complex subunit PrcB family protein [Candidatus Ethanoperedens thermophilum]